MRKIAFILIAFIVTLSSCKKQELVQPTAPKEVVEVSIKGEWLLSSATAYNTQYYLGNETEVSTTEYADNEQFELFKQSGISFDIMTIGKTRWNINKNIETNDLVFAYNYNGTILDITTSPTRRVMEVIKLDKNTLEVMSTSQYSGDYGERTLKTRLTFKRQ